MITRVLITGASGYIGSKVVKKFIHSNCKVAVLLRKASNLENLIDIQSKVKIFYCDESFSSLNEIFLNNQFDCVLHLASYTNYNCEPRNIKSMLDSNIAFGTHLLEAMAINNCRNLVNTSTYWEHLDSYEYQPNSLYAASKKAFQDIVEHYVFNEGLSAITLKLCDVYGDNDQRKKIFSLLNDSWQKGEPLDMTSGEQKINLIHIDDVTEAFFIAARYLVEGKFKNSHSKFFVAQKYFMSLKEAVALYLKVSNRKISINWGKIPYRRNQIMDPFVGELLIGWEPKIDLEQGIKKMIQE